MRTVKLGDAGADTGTCDSDMRDELSGSSGGTSPVTSPGHCHHIAQKISQMFQFKLLPEKIEWYNEISTRALLKTL